MTSEFWQNEIERLASRLLDRCLSGRESVRFEEIAEQDFPEVFHYMVKLLVQNHFASESPFSLSHSSRYDFDSVEFREACESFRREVLNKALVSRAELETLALSAVRLETEILVRPRQTLLDLVFQERTECRCADVLTVVRGFGERRAFVERVVTHLRNFDQGLIGKDDVQAIANKAEITVYKETPVSALLTEVLLYQKFEAEATGETQSMVRSQILLEILKNRDLDEMFEDLRKQAGDKELWTVTEIENFLERFLLIGSMDEPPTQPKSRTEHSGRFSRPGTTQDLRQRSKISDRRERFEAMQFNFLDDPGIEPPSADAPPAEELTEELIHHLTEDEAPHGNGHGANGSGQSKTDESEEGPAQTFANRVEAADRDLIVKSVFDNDAAAYDAFMKSLATMDEWMHAKRAIDIELGRREIDSDAEEAVRLSDIVFAQFLSRR